MSAIGTLDNRLWVLLETGQETPQLVRVGNRLKTWGTQAGWLKDEMSKAPADFPQLKIECGVRSTNSAYNLDPTLATESPTFLRDDGGSNDLSVQRSYQVRITLTTNDVKTNAIQELREAVENDIIRGDTALGLVPPFTSVSYGPFTGEQRFLRRADNPRSGVQVVLTFTVTTQQSVRVIVRGEE